MGILYCDGDRFRKALVASASWLSENSETLNRLNVFPVPDGDTGTNMSLTLISAVDELKGMEGASLQDVLETAAHGALMGARGCSGVIISQLIAGFAEVGRGKTKLGPHDIITGFQQGAKRAYLAVIEPVEGTVLTVIREASEEAVRYSKGKGDLVELLEKILNRSKVSLENTPNLLPVLAQAGVVDAGGQGFVYMLEGILKLVHGEDIKTFQKSSALEPSEAAQARVSESWDTPYCTEFIMSAKNAEIPGLRDNFAGFGTDLVVVGWNDLVRVHIHTSDPEKVLASAHSYGKPINVKIDDMRKQHRHIVENPIITKYAEKEKNISTIMITPGDGIAAIAKSLGSDLVVMSDQRNPSVSELISAIDSAYSNNVLLLPNDGNIIPAAIQAANMSNKQTKIVPSRNISQGLSAIIAFQSDADMDDNIAEMEKVLKKVKHGEIARAVRNAKYGDLVIKENDMIGRFNGSIHVSVDDLEKAILKLLKVMVKPDDEIITIFYGAEIKRSEAELILEKVESTFPEKEIELHYGGQPYCYYILSVE